MLSSFLIHTVVALFGGNAVFVHGDMLVLLKLCFTLEQTVFSDFDIYSHRWDVVVYRQVHFMHQGL